MSTSKPIPDCLAYAGMFGHMWHVTHEHNGEEVCGLHCNYGTEALRYFDDPTNMAIAIYTRTPRGKWRRATRGAASIDGPAQP